VPSAGVLRISIDDSDLLDRPDFPSGLPAFDELARWSRTHATHLLRGELAHFRNRRNCSVLVDRCEILRKVSASEGTVRKGQGKTQVDPRVLQGPCRPALIMSEAGRFLGTAIPIFGNPLVSRVLAQCGMPKAKSPAWLQL
jgi:hypothetical protein